jgi:hypothetical protein
MDLKSILIKYFAVIKKKKDESYSFTIFLYIGINVENKDIDDIPLRLPIKASKKEATQILDTNMEASQDDNIKIKIKPSIIDMDAFNANKDPFGDLDNDTTKDILDNLIKDFPKNTSKIKLLESNNTSPKKLSKKRSFNVHNKVNQDSEVLDTHVRDLDIIDSELDSTSDLVLDAPAFRTRRKKAAK